jgi:hypothetical protein
MSKSVAPIDVVPFLTQANPSFMLPDSVLPLNKSVKQLVQN